jgi:hypothetical protein
MAWGPGNFENDRGVDWLHSGFHMPLVERLRAGVTHPDERTGNELMAAAEVLALISEQVRRNYLHPAEVAGWQETFLRSWERYADAINGPAGFKEARRAEIVRTFGRLLAVAEWFGERAVAETIVGPVELAVISEEFIAPAEREQLQTRIGAALGESGVGRVISGESSPEPDNFSIRTRIGVVVTDHEGGVRTLRRVLRAGDVPSATWIHQVRRCGVGSQTPNQALNLPAAALLIILVPLHLSPRQASFAFGRRRTRYARRRPTLCSRQSQPAEVWLADPLVLTGAWTKERHAALPADDWRREKNRQFQEPLFSRNLRLVEVLRGIGGKYGKSPGEVAIAWVLRQSAVTAAIVGARKPGQLSQLIGAAQWRLSLAAASEIERFLAENPG